MAQAAATPSSPPAYNAQNYTGGTTATAATAAPNNEPEIYMSQPQARTRAVALRQKNCAAATCLWCPPFCALCLGNTHRCYIEDWHRGGSPNWIRLFTLNYFCFGWLTDVCSLNKQVQARNEALHGAHTRAVLHSTSPAVVTASGRR